MELDPSTLKYTLLTHGVAAYPDSITILDQKPRAAAPPDREGAKASDNHKGLARDARLTNSRRNATPYCHSGHDLPPMYVFKV